jgi:hypothetical protein
MINRSLLILGVLALAACAGIEPKPFIGPNGKTAYSMHCSGMGRTLEACYQKAGEICPAGYNIINSTSGTIAVPTYGGHGEPAGTVATPDYGLAIECK